MNEDASASASAIGGRLAGVDAGQDFEEGNSFRWRAGAAGAGEGLLRPFSIAQGQQWEVEQPFARVVDDIEVERRGAGPAGEPALRLEFQHQPQLADAAGRLRPERRLAGQRGKMLLIGKARDPGVGGFGKLSPDKAALCKSGKAGQTAACQQVVDECGDEDGLAGAAQASDAEAQGRREAAGRHIG